MFASTMADPAIPRKAYTRSSMICELNLDVRGSRRQGDYRATCTTCSVNKLQLVVAGGYSEEHGRKTSDGEDRSLNTRRKR